MQINAIEAKRQEKLAELTSSFQEAYFEIQDNQRIHDLYKKILIPKNEENLEITLQSYRNGDSNFLELLDIQRQQLEFELLSLKALSQSYKYHAQIKELRGQYLKED